MADGDLAGADLHGKLHERQQLAERFVPHHEREQQFRLRARRLFAQLLELPQRLQNGGKADAPYFLVALLGHAFE